MLESSAKWRDTHRQASLEEILPDGVVRCHLSPRKCTLREGQNGFCGVRGNRDGRLVTMNFGKSVHATEETIETEAVNHFAPGERILSMGNIGCMMNCSYCHNWRTSQAKYVSDKDVYYYEPQDVVDMALRHGIRMLSWTYNDPVVWHEFVVETARLGKRHGLMNLYKSAFYITPEAVAELAPHMDIFSISLKSMSEDYYRKFTKGRLGPVLEAIQCAFATGAHLELSTLMITGISDNQETAREVSEWVLRELNPYVPLHFVRFHPDYRMTDTVRTPIAHLEAARSLALEMGVEQVYLGNVYDTDAANTYCRGCNALLISRYGLNARSHGLDERGLCRSCGRDAHVEMRGAAAPQKTRSEPEHGVEGRTFHWHGDIRSLHAQVKNTTSRDLDVFERRLLADGRRSDWKVTPLTPGESYRFIVAKSDPGELGCEIVVPEGVASNLHEVFDRAHFPTQSIEEFGVSRNDRTPLPLYQRPAPVS
jgi:pyruvate formate lyase activating enzyme